jgi:hypothetical protein
MTQLSAKRDALFQASVNCAPVVLAVSLAACGPGSAASGAQGGASGAGAAANAGGGGSAAGDAGSGGAIPGAIYASPQGNDDSGDGSFEQPFASPARALQSAQASLESASTDVVIALRGGTYELGSPLSLGKSASGKPGARLKIQSHPGEQAILSGGTRLTGFAPVAGTQMVKVHVGLERVRQFYGNGAFRPRASSDRWLEVKGWSDGPAIAANSIPAIARPSTLEVFLQTNWRSYMIGVDSVTTAGELMTLQVAPGTLAALRMSPDYVYPSTAKKVLVESALELVDQPGEWFFDEASRELYYLPVPGEDLDSTEFAVPRLQTVVELSGTSHVTLYNLTMAYAAWNRPGEARGFGCWQADNVHYPADAGAPMGGVAPAAVSIDESTDIVLERCTVHGTGAVGIGAYRNVSDLTLTGMRIFDTGGAAVTIGSGEQSGSGRITIQNSVVRRAGRTNYGAPAIQSFYADAISILHCDLADLPYTGIALGWGWNSTAGQTWNGANHRISNNRVADFMKVTYDGGGVYTLGKNLGSVISGNYFKDMHAAFGCLYNDEGSQGFALENNVCENVPAWLHWWTDTIRNNSVRSTYSTTANARLDAPDNQFEAAVVVPDANWPPAARAIIEASGVQAEYADLLAPAP